MLFREDLFPDILPGIALLSFYEFSQFVKNKGIKVNIWLGYAAIILLVSNRYAPFFDNFNFLILFVVVISLIELFRNNGSAIYNLGGTLLGVLYLGLFASSLVGIREFYPAVDGLYYRGGYIIISVLFRFGCVIRRLTMAVRL